MIEISIGFKINLCYEISKNLTSPNLLQRFVSHQFITILLVLWGGIFAFRLELSLRIQRSRFVESEFVSAAMKRIFCLRYTLVSSIRVVASSVSSFEFSLPLSPKTEISRSYSCAAASAV